MRDFFRGFERFSEVFRGFQRFSELFERFSEIFRGFQRSSQRPSQRQISSQRLSVLLPLIVLPLELSPNTVDTFISATDRHPDRTPCKGSTLGRFSVNFFGQFRSKRTKTDKKSTENRLKTDPLQDPDRRLPLRREGLWLK